jgi:hypothetical protein
MPKPAWRESLRELCRRPWVLLAGLVAFGQPIWKALLLVGRLASYGSTSQWVWGVMNSAWMSTLLGWFWQSGWMATTPLGVIWLGYLITHPKMEPRASRELIPPAHPEASHPAQLTPLSPAPPVAASAPGGLAGLMMRELRQDELVKQQQPVSAPTPHPSSDLAPPTPDAVREAVNAATPFMTSEVARQFVGVPVTWTGRFSSITRHDETNSMDIFLNSDGGVLFLARGLAVVPALRLLKKNDVMTISGTIKEIQPMWIDIEPSFFVSVRKASPENK